MNVLKTKYPINLRKVKFFKRFIFSLMGTAGVFAVFTAPILAEPAGQACSSCSFVTTKVNVNDRVPGCAYCGDDIVNRPQEICDGTDLGPSAWDTSIPKDVWDARVCNSPTSANPCTFNLPPRCGDGILNGNEVCDGTQFSSVLTRDAGVSDAAWLAKTCNPPNSSTPCSLCFPDSCGRLCGAPDYGKAETSVLAAGVNVVELIPVFSALPADGKALAPLSTYSVPLTDLKAAFNISMTNLSGVTVSGAELVNGQIQFKDSGSAARSQVSETWGKPCNHGGCGSCNCGTRVSGGHIYTTTYRFKDSVDISKTISISAQGSCGPLNISLTVKIKGEREFDDYYETFELSPVSLNLASSRLNLMGLLPTKVAFKIFEGQKGEIYWYASDISPLLVWDPLSVGKIDDGKQLFGTWTFGKSWDSGYAALASLDRNADNKLSGEELVGIRLWLDAEQDGKIGNAEIRDLAEFGITDLSVVPNREMNIPVHGIKFLVADEGYSISVNGVTTKKESFDWFVPGGSVEATFQDEVKRLKTEGYTVKEWSEVPLNYAGNRSNGYMVFKKENDAKLSGYHISAIRVKADDGKSSSYLLAASPLTGVYNDSTFEFVISDRQPGAIMSQTLKGSGTVKKGNITPGNMTISTEQGPGKVMVRETKWKFLDAKPF